MDVILLIEGDGESGCICIYIYKQMYAYKYMWGKNIGVRSIYGDDNNDDDDDDDDDDGDGGWTDGQQDTHDYERADGT